MYNKNDIIDELNKDHDKIFISNKYKIFYKNDHIRICNIFNSISPECDTEIDIIDDNDYFYLSNNKNNQTVSFIKQNEVIKFLLMNYIVIGYTNNQLYCFYLKHNKIMYYPLFSEEEYIMSINQFINLKNMTWFIIDDYNIFNR